MQLSWHYGTMQQFFGLFLAFSTCAWFLTLDGIMYRSESSHYFLLLCIYRKDQVDWRFSRDHGIFSWAFPLNVNPSATAAEKFSLLGRATTVEYSALVLWYEWSKIISHELPWPGYQNEEQEKVSEKDMNRKGELPELGVCVERGLHCCACVIEIISVPFSRVKRAAIMMMKQIDSINKNTDWECNSLHRLRSFSFKKRNIAFVRFE